MGERGSTGFGFRDFALEGSAAAKEDEARTAEQGPAAAAAGASSIVGGFGTV